MMNRKMIWANPVSQKAGPLKPDKAPAHSFSFLYIILLVCTIILICFYSLPLNINTSTLKPLNSELMPILEDGKTISILRELFGDFPPTAESASTSLPVTSNSPKAVVEATTILPHTTDNFSATASKAGDEDLTTDFDDPTVTNHVTNKPRDKDNSVRQDTSNSPKSVVNAPTISPQTTDNLSATTSKARDEDLTTDFDDPTVTNHVTNKPRDKDNSVRQDTSNSPKSVVKAPTISPQTTDNLSATTSKAGDEDLTTDFDDPTVTNHVTNKPRDRDDSVRQDTSNSPKSVVKAPTISPQTADNLSATTSKAGDEDLTTDFDDPTVTNHVTNKPKDEDNSSRQDNSKNHYLDTTEETQNTSPNNKEEESTVTFATRTVSNPGATNNPNGKKKTPRKNNSISESINPATEFMPEEEFLVFSDHCKIPNIDPYHPSILKYIEESPPLVCKDEEPITKTEGNTLFIDEEAIRRRNLNISEFTCLYHEIGRPKAGLSDNGVGLGFNDTFTDKVEIKAEFIRVICSFQNGTELYQGFHSFVHDKPEVEKRCNQHKSSGYSILIVGIDAMSRLNMHRQLKKTARYLLKDMEAVEMYGFNKVGDNTFPNLMPLLTGYDERELKHVCWNASRTNPLDECNYAWKQYAKEGYRTFYAEDAPHMSSFNYVKAGFQYQPTDYYLRHFMLVMEQTLGSKRMLNTYACVGNISETEVVLRWAEQFASHFKDRKYFSFSWINGLTHDFLNKGSAVDHLYEKFFRNLHTSGALNKTIVILMGDHGMRWGSIRKTYIGRLEERLPMLLIALPPEFKREHPTEAKALQLNSRRLVTPFDIHATLMNILHLDKNFTFVNPDDVDPALAENYTARANTLFQPVPEDRSCDDASIDEHWCTCENSLPVDTDDKIVLKAADFLIDYVNSLLKPVRSKCALLELKSISDARVWTASEEHQGHSLNDTILTIIVKVRPSAAIFEATVRTSEPERRPELLGTVSRLNLYGDQSACIQDAVLRKYCYCS